MGLTLRYVTLIRHQQASNFQDFDETKEASLRTPKVSFSPLRITFPGPRGGLENRLGSGLVMTQVIKVPEEFKRGHALPGEKVHVGDFFL